MALRNQPYIPLYVQDFLTDEKLMECSALATGVYIRIMCIMHKSEQYGTILLEQKYKQSEQQSKNFAAKLAKHLPYELAEIEAAINELLAFKVLKIDGDLLIQKRMVSDNLLSEKRAKAGRKGGKKTSNNFATKFAIAKSQANTENEYEIEGENEINKKERRQKFEPPSLIEVVEYSNEQGSLDLDEPNRFIDYYTSNGWKVGKNQMKDWKAAYRNWLKNSKTFNNVKHSDNQRKGHSIDGVVKAADEVLRQFSIQHGFGGDTE